ncbi:MAG: hypothetical protein KDK10_08770 [Maritimibacter sp.]|nr:hypothetical protein [Maritimibacter sp.]
MSNARSATARNVAPAEEPGDDLPPPRIRKPGSGRETLIHWIITVVGFSAMLLVGLYFTK